MSGSNCIPFPQMPDGQIIQYEHDAAFLQEQQVRLIFIIESTTFRKEEKRKGTDFDEVWQIALNAFQQEFLSWQKPIVPCSFTCSDCCKSWWSDPVSTRELGAAYSECWRSGGCCPLCCDRFALLGKRLLHLFFLFKTLCGQCILTHKLFTFFDWIVKIYSIKMSLFRLSL